MSVKVAVRVRPFNAREQGDQLIIEMKDAQTIVEYDDKTRPYTFDYSFWSHDGFEMLENGYASALPDSNYADQQTVYEALGKEVLDNAWQGYHCCLFAYGQTGAGKSYSMIGYGANRGIVPIASNEIFKRIELPQEPGSNPKTYEIAVSMIEIYNEKIQDLLVLIEQRPSGGLKVRESKRVGVYVQGLKKVPVKSYAEIEEIMEIGNTHRTIGATEMNATSSRAHTIIVIDFKQTEILEKKKVEKNSVINLVDLAGSEKVSKTKAKGDRLKEGCSINKSLTTLGLVISILAEKAGGKAAKKVVPYRNSALTRILQNALGGNSKTIMICAISPSNRNYEETVSTLRYADQAKKIKNMAVVNESETDKLIRNLKEENEALKKLLKDFEEKGFTLPPNLASLSEEMKREEKAQQDGLDSEDQLQLQNSELLGQENDDSQHSIIKVQGGQKNDDDDDSDTTTTTLDTSNDTTSTMEEGSSEKHQLSLALEALQENELMMSQMNKNEEIDFSEIIKANKKDKNLPHITNVNEDAIMSGKIVHEVQEGHDLHVGRKDGNPVPQIRLSAIGILCNHARIFKNSRGIFLEPLSPEACPFIRVNGETVQKERKLSHLDRIVFGTASFFVYKDPQSSEESKVKEEDIDFEFIQKEITKVSELIENTKNMQLKDSERFIENEKQELKEKISSLLPQVTEVNLIAIELRRMIKISLFIEYYYCSEEQRTQKNQEPRKRLKLKVRVLNEEKGYSYVWDLECFQNRYYMIKDVIEDYYAKNEFPIVSDDQDPFWDPQAPQLVGKAHLSLIHAACGLEYSQKIIIYSEEKEVGSLEVETLPCGQDGLPIDLETLINEDRLVDDPIELLTKRVDFIVRIKNVKLPTGMRKDCVIEYGLGVGEKAEYFSTLQIANSTEDELVDFNYEKHHTIKKVSRNEMEFFKTGAIEFKLKVCKDKLPPKRFQASDEDLMLVSPERVRRTNDDIISPVSHRADLFKKGKKKLYIGHTRANQQDGDQNQTTGGGIIGGGIMARSQGRRRANSRLQDEAKKSGENCNLI